MSGQIKFDTFLPTSLPTIEPITFLAEKSTTNPPIFSRNIANVTNYETFDHIQEILPSTSGNFAVAPLLFTAISTVSTLGLIYILTKDSSRNNSKKGISASGRSTPLPGFGILGDKVNEVIELFLDALTVYVHNDNKWECQRRMLCEANARAGEYGVFQGVVMYFLSLGVSLLLQNQRVSDSLEAMKIGRRGGDCAQLYQKCPFSL